MAQIHQSLEGEGFLLPISPMSLRLARINHGGLTPSSPTQLEQALHLETDVREQELLENKSLAQQNIDLRRRLDEDQAAYKRKLQAYQEGQQRQALLVQKLQAKVCFALPRGMLGESCCFCILPHGASMENCCGTGSKCRCQYQQEELCLVRLSEPQSRSLLGLD